MGKRGNLRMATPRLALFTTISLAFYLGLAIAGLGGPRPFFSHPPLIAVAAATVALGIAALFTEGHVGAGIREDRSNRWVIGVLGALGLHPGVSAGVLRPHRFSDLRRRGRALDRIYPVCGRRRPAPCARLRARPALQRPGRDSTGSSTGHKRPLQGGPSSELSWAFHQCARLGACVPLLGGRGDRGVDADRRTCPHPIGRAIAAARLSAPNTTLIARARGASRRSFTRPPHAAHRRVVRCVIPAHPLNLRPLSSRWT